eukprot:CAMPEP_0113481658 /NCGR_PEP_ID=MMETSP0014_2-20120614/22521_1 /TAXON_ID=2857 /ORGANISM="Nitzschia sp." /LENGTH=122 /DNA_ID=CAMNT_0000375159 /DNA_START=78 /DNA_END=446 /DNA_ORIENTATION=- /assembly_acc=CAM_ASM_000159
MSHRALAPLLRRSVATARSSQRALRGGGTPPMPVFARVPAPSEPLVENHDCLFDDAVAPELALDFDCQNVSTAEGFMSWAMGIGAFVTLFYTIKYVEDPPACDPAIKRGDSKDVVYQSKYQH